MHPPRNHRETRRTLCDNLDVDSLIILGTDPHSLEHPLEQWMFRHYISRFFGSAGTLVLCKSGAAALWTDGRYELAVRELCQSCSAPWEAHINNERAWEEQLAWIHMNCDVRQPHDNQPTVGLCTAQCTKITYDDIAAHAKTYNLMLKDIPYPVLRQTTAAFLRDEKKYTEAAVLESTADFSASAVWHLRDKHLPYDSSRIAHIYSALNNYENAAYVTADLHEIAFITGMRANIVPHLLLLPCVFVAHSCKQKQRLTHTVALPNSLHNHNFMRKSHTHMGIISDALRVVSYETLLDNPSDMLQDMLPNDTGTVLYNPNCTPAAFAHALENINTQSNDSNVEAFRTRVEIQTTSAPSVPYKDIRTNHEIQLLRECCLHDCAAILDALAEIHLRMEQGATIYEADIARELTKSRCRRAGYIEESFTTISATGKNSAVPHYHVHQDGDVAHPWQPYLIDCGAHYAHTTYGGTTDITRSFIPELLMNPEYTPSGAHNVPMAQQERAAYKQDYTAVLDAHITLARSVVPAGTCGRELDSIARGALALHEQRNYNHGTGHGIGFCTDVHEGTWTIGPMKLIGTSRDDIPPNAVLSNEPGCYNAGSWGIRLENMLRVTEAETNKTHMRRLLCFETLTFFPFHSALIDMTMLNEQNRSWLKWYQKQCALQLPKYFTHPHAHKLLNRFL